MCGNLVEAEGGEGAHALYDHVLVDVELRIHQVEEQIEASFLNQLAL